MAIKITKNMRTSIGKAIANKIKPNVFVNRMVTQFKNEIIREIPSEVIGMLEKGRTPVEGGQFKKTYSQAYRDQIQKLWGPALGKQVRPVNLKLTGQLHNSLQATRTNDGVELEFKDEVAKYHDIQGAGRSKVIRRMLPNTGERFTRSIQRKIIKIAEDVFERIALRG